MKLMACSRQIQALLRERSGIVEKYDDMIADWDEAHGKVDRKRKSSRKSDRSFSFTPTTPTTPPHQRNVDNHFSMQLEMMRRQMQGQQFQVPMANAHFNMQIPRFSWGWGSQFGGSYNYGRQPSYHSQPFFDYSQYGAQYGNPALRHFEQPHTMPGGRFSFNPVNSGGGQMYIGGTPGFYDAPMGGGASGGFSFGM